MKQKAIVMLSGGLDSILTLKIMQEKKYKITAVYFKLPFSKDESESLREFTKREKVKLIILDCTRGILLKRYLGVIKNPKYNRGSGINPCIDCKIFMFKEIKKIAIKKNINTIATGEVLGERPLSQTKKAFEIIEKDLDFSGEIIRPLTNFYNIRGRKRKIQISLAKKFKIKKYPSPSGGCLLCEKNLRKKFKTILKRGMNSEEIKLINTGRYFLIDNCIIILGRNYSENKLIEQLNPKKELIVPNHPGPTAIILDRCSDKTKQKVKNLINAYSKKGDLNQRALFEKYRL